MNRWASYVLIGIGAMLLLVSFSDPAAGATFCKSNQTPCASLNQYQSGTSVKFSLAPGTELQKEWVVSETCKEVTGEGKTETAGGSGTPVGIALSNLKFNCTCSTTVMKPGRLIVESIEGVMNGTVKWVEFEIKENCGLGVECTVAGEISKGIALKGGVAPTWNFVWLPVSGKSGGCSEQLWTGKFQISTPTPLYVSGASSESTSGEGVLCALESTPCPETYFGLPATYGAGDPISASLKPGTFSLINAGFASIKCEEAEIDGEIVNAGGAAEPVIGTLSSFSFGKCNCKVSVLKPGRFSVSWTSGLDGALRLEGFEVAVDCGGKECTFGGTAKEGITLEGSLESTPLIQAEEAVVPKKSGIAECSASSKWLAEYEVTSGSFAVVQN